MTVFSHGRRARVQRSFAVVAAAAAAISMVHTARADSGTWTNIAGGNWGDIANWNAGVGPIADGVGFDANFNTLNITADANVVLTEARTIGTLQFGDITPATAGSWLLGDGGNAANILTLGVNTGAPTITVNNLGATKNATLNMEIAGTQGLTKAGVGWLVLGGTNTYSGATTIDRGLLTFNTAGSIGNVGAGSVTVNAAGAVGYGAATIGDATFLSKVNTASTGAFAISATDAATNFNFTAGPFASFANMGIGATPAATVLYTGTITPAASTYRLGGGGGTLQMQNGLAAGNSLVVGNGSGASGTVILAAANTYDGTTTIANGMTLQVGTGLTTSIGNISAANVANDGSLVFNRAGTFTVANTITGTGSLIKRGNGGTMSFTGSFTGGALNVDRSAVASTPVVFSLDGGTIVSSALSTIQGQGNNQTAASFIVNSGSATFNGGLRVDGSDTNGTIRVNGGTVAASDITVIRNAGTAAAFGSGLIFAGGTTTAGTMNVATGNSFANMSVEGGTLNVSGAVLIANQSTSGRGGAIRVTSGTFSAANLIMSRVNGTNANNVAQATFSGGISTIDQLTLGFDSAVNAGSATVGVSGGTLYLGSGGVVKNGSFTSTINLTSGTLGAKADWSATHNLVLNGVPGTPFTIKAADAADLPHNIVINGNVSGAGSLIKSGGGSLTLNGNSTYAGTTNVSAGSLIGSTSSIVGSVVNDGNVTFNQATNGTYSAVISGSGSLTKTGAGTLILNSPQGYTGATAVNAGVLRMGGAQATSGVTVANGAGLAMGNGGASVNALTLGAGGADAMTLFVNSGSGIAPLNVIANNGLVANGTTTIDLGIAGYTLGQHVLVDYAGAIGGGGFGAFTRGTLPPRVTASLVNNVANTSIDLNVTAIDFPQWVGNLNSDWDINTTANWKEATSGTTTTYLQNSVPGDQVLFTDAATGTTDINLTTTVQPSFVTVNNTSKNYTFSGGGRISGPTGINKQGTGSLTVSNTGGSDHTGVTNILGGSIVLGGNNVLSDASPVNVNGGTLDIGNFSETTGAVTLTSGAISGGGGILTAPSYDVRSGTITAMLSGPGALDKTAAGTVALNAQASYSGNTNINEGTLQLGGSDVIPIATTITMGAGSTSGILDLNSFNQQIERLLSSGTGTANSIRNSVNVGGAATLTITGANPGNANSTYGGALDGNLALRWASAGVLTLTGTSTFTGGTTVDNLGTLAIGSDAALGAVPATSSNNITFTNVGGTLRAVATDVTLAATRDIFLDSVTANFDSNGGANTMTINGVVNGSGHVGKVGNGTVIFNAANTYSGNTTIIAGNLRAGHNQAFNNSTVRITGSAASMQLGNGVTLTNNLISQSNSDNMVDLPVAGANATFAGNVTIEAGGGGNQYRVAANGAGATLTLTGTATVPNTFVANAGNIIMTGSASITATGTAANALLGRPNTASTVMSLLMKDSANASFAGFTNLGNARNMTELSLTLQDSASYSTAGTFNLLETTATTATSAVNLNGGMLTSGAFLKSSVGAGHTATINFDGGVLKAAASSTAYVPAAAGLSGKVKNGGATIDTNGFDITFAAPLEADGTGGLTKTGVGALVLSGATTYTGPTVVNAGKLQLETNLASSSSVSVADGATVELSPLKTRVIKTGDVSLAATARIDLKDNKLLTSKALGTFTGGAYTGLQGDVARAYNFGAWDQPGLMTSMPEAGPLIGTTTIGVSNGEAVLFLGPAETGTFAGQTVTGATTIAMYTYAGDVNFDGLVDAADYGVIDNWVQFPGTSGYANGDFNYDGVIDAGDYGIIDNTIQLQGAPFPTGAVADAGGLSGVTAVPEPASLSVLGIAAATLLSRRRRRRRRHTAR